MDGATLRSRGERGCTSCNPTQPRLRTQRNPGCAPTHPGCTPTHPGCAPTHPSCNPMCVQVLDDEAEGLTLKLWRMLLFEIKRAEAGI